MTRKEYFARQRALSRLQAKQEAAQTRLIHAAHMEAYRPFIAALRQGKAGHIDREALAEKITGIIRDEGGKPAREARALHSAMEAEIFGRLGIARGVLPVNIYRSQKPHNKKKAGSEIQANARAPRQSRVQGRAWGVSAGLRSGVSTYRRDPDTGNIIWDDTPLEYAFTKRAELSGQVWRAVEEEEANIFAIVQTGRAMGRDVKDIARDLETFIAYPDGGGRVLGRWGKLEPGDEAYVKRFGRAGIDYRTMRIMRTETAAMLADEQAAIARDSSISSGLVDWVLEPGRDGWNCRCAELAAGGPYNIDDLPAAIPLHPNCNCQLRPRLLTDDEVFEQFEKELARLEGETGDEAASQDWLKEQLDEIDSRMIERPVSLAPALKLDRAVDYSGVSLADAYAKEYTFLREGTAKTGNEMMSIMTEEKQVVGTWEGSPSGVNMGAGILDIFDEGAEKSLSIMHTHPGNLGLSVTDFYLLSRYKSIKGVSVETAKGKAEIVNIRQGRRPTKTELEEESNIVLYAILQRPEYKNIKKDDPRWSDIIMKRNKRLKTIFGWR